MARMVLKETGFSVEISYDDVLTERRVTRVFSAPTSHVGYVREGNGQVCEKLYSTGTTLRASLVTLPAVIRREYRAMRRDEARAFNLS